MQNKQVALVTGANRGFGYELVKQLASMEFKVILTSRDQRKGYEIAQQLAETGLDVSSVVMDVTDQESIRQAAMTITETVGRLDILVNNAGVFLYSTYGKAGIRKDYQYFFGLWSHECHVFRRSRCVQDLQTSNECTDPNGRNRSQGRFQNLCSRSVLS